MTAAPFHPVPNLRRAGLIVFTIGPVVANSPAGELDSPAPCLNVAVTLVADHWSQLGAKPNSLVSYT